MKTTITMFAVAAMFAACNSNPKIEEKSTSTISNIDTTGLAEFQMQKEMMKEGELIETEGIYDGNTTNNLNGNSPAVATGTSRRVSSSAPARRSTASRSTSRSSGSGTRSSGSGSGSEGSGTVSQAPAKKGWSKAAKGAVIGGATGAVAGAVISKKKGKGAIIGGILGAGGGYVIGRGGDKRDGRN